MQARKYKQHQLEQEKNEETQLSYTGLVIVDTMQGLKIIVRQILLQN